MSRTSDALYAQARIIPIKPANQVKQITKQPGGSLFVELNSGDSYTIPADELEMQAFVVYTMLNTDTR